MEEKKIVDWEKKKSNTLIPTEEDEDPIEFRQGIGSVGDQLGVGVGFEDEE